MSRAAAIAALLAAVMMLLAARPGGLEAQQEADAESVRARILERVRGPQEVPADSVEGPADAAETPDDPADTADDPVDDDPQATDPPDVVTVDVDSDLRRRPPAELPDGADDLMRSLIELEGFRSASYTGQRAEFTGGDRRLVLFGLDEINARFSGDGVRLEADSSIIYSDQERRVRTVGRTLLTPAAGDPVLSRTLVYDLDEGRGTAVGAETVYNEGGSDWIVRGELDSVRQGELFGSDTRFTSCDLADPHSHFQARHMKVVADQVLVARSVMMYVEDVPVLWLPFIAQNLEPDRASGLLTPTFSINDIVRTSTGHQRRLSNLGFYWAMSDYSDATIAFDWFSGQYTGLEGSVRYSWARQFLDGSLSMKQYWRSAGSQEFGMNTRHAWQASERTSISVAGRYMSSSDFVREHSLDPREINQTVNSDASLSHRFNWGSLSLGARRQQYLNEERVDMTLPSANLSFSTITLFGAPPATASWYNNLSISGSMEASRQLQNRPLQEADEFVRSRAGSQRTRGRASGSLSLGDVSLSGSVASVDRVTRDVPLAFLEDEEPPPDGRTDLSRHDINWSTSLSYRQRLIGTTILTPNVSLSGSMLRDDEITAAESLVHAPMRLSVGASIRTEVLGFYPGFGRFDAIRHKITPGLSWSFAPEVQPTALQAEVFGSAGAQRRNTFTLSFNQTWEARVREDAVEEEEDLEEPEAPVDEVEGITELPDPEDPDDPDDPDQDEALSPERLTSAFDDEDLARPPRSRTVNLLSLRTTALSYDQVRGDSLGRFIEGITTTNLSNDVSSDYLEGLNLSFTHQLFDDRGDGPRTFSPHLSRLSVGFSLSDQSSVVQWVSGLLTGDPELERPPENQNQVDPEEEIVEDPSERPGPDPFQVIPGDGSREQTPVRREGWDARIDYALHRTRGALDPTQTLRANVSFAPTPSWSATWSTTYDAQNHRFLDHNVSLRRDLHEWEATFGFRQTATGNWSFNFEVSLRANRDLSFDYRQRSTPSGGALPF